MKKRKRRAKKPRPPRLRIIRHHETLTPEETDEVVETVADLIVNFVQKKALASGVTSSSADGQSSTEARGNPPSGKGKGRR